MTDKILPTVSTLRRWKRDALEQAFEALLFEEPQARKYDLMLRNFAKVCSILVDEYPHIMNYERVSQENVDLHNRLQKHVRGEVR